MIVSRIAAILGVALALATPIAASAQDFSSKPIRIIVPWAPGGNVDITARAIAPGMGEALSTNVIVETKPGAGGTLGTGQVANGTPDGHLLTLGSTAAITISPSVFKDVSYDPVKDLVAIGPIHSVPLVLTAALKTPVADYKQFVELARAKNGQLAVGTPGIASTNHLTIELVSSLAGIKVLHVPYKGAGPALNDLVAGQLDMMVDQTPPSIPHIKEGRIRAIAVTAPMRVPSLPDVPTFDELGLKGFEASTFTGLFGPAGLPKPIVDKLSDALKKALANPAVRERFAATGAQMLEQDREQFAAYVAADFRKWAKIVKDAKITSE